MLDSTDRRGERGDCDGGELHRHQGRPLRQDNGDQGLVAYLLARRKERPFPGDHGHKGRMADRAGVKRSQQSISVSSGKGAVSVPSHR